MGNTEKNSIDYLKSQLDSKSRLKQHVWKNAVKFFQGLKNEAEALINVLKNSDDIDDDIRIDIQSVNDFEFHIFFGSDLVVYSLQTNVVTFDPANYLIQNKYFQQNPELTFFGQLLIYDFMADSLKYNRTEDIGYLLGRVLINKDNHFMIEGVRGLHYLFEGIEKTKVSKENFSLLINKSLATAVDSDLLAPDFSQLQFVTHGLRLKGDRELGHGKKIGFQTSAEDDVQN